MDITEKIVRALRERLKASYVSLDDDDGISGFVVSPRFEGMSALDRQGLIDETLGKPPAPLTQDERRRVLMIAGLTPVEYDAVGAKIRVHKIKAMGGGAVEVVLRGNLSDAEYVRGTFKGQKGVQTTEPKSEPGAVGIFMSFRAKRNGASPLTKAEAVRVLQNDRYIEVMPGV